MDPAHTPQTAPESAMDALLKRWRGKALDLLLLVAALTGFPAYALVGINAVLYGRLTLLVAAYMLCYLFTIGLLLYRRLDFRFRFWGLIGVSLVNAAASFARLGLSGSGRLWLVVLPIIAAIVFGAKGAYITAACGIALYAGFVGLAYFRVMETWLASPPDPLAFGFWVEGGAALLVFIPIMVVLVEGYVRLHTRTLLEAQRANMDLERMTSKLKESEERYRSLVELSPELISVQRDGSFIYMNPAGLRLLGASRPEEVLGKPVLDFIHSDYRPIVEERLERIENRNEDVPFIHEKYIRLDGTAVDVDVAGRPFSYQGHRAILTVGLDVSEHKRAEDSLRESERRYRRLVENAPLGIISIDGEGKIKDVNARLVSILGSPSADATQAVNMFTFLPLVEAGVAANFRQCLESGEPGVFETLYRSKWGKDRFLRYHLNPIRDFEERIAGVQGIVEDISERKRLEDQLLQAQKMEAIGTLAGGIAHDFNNILAAIIGYTELAGLDVAEGSKARYYLQQSLRASNRAKDLVQQILAFSRQGRQERRPLDIGPIVKEGLKLLRASLPATIEIKQEIERDLGAIEADPTQIHQVLMNLCTNAAHAMEEKGGTLGVSLRRVAAGREEAGAPGDIEAGRYLRLRVSDTGEGMDPEVLKRIYDPYFTTKGPGKGTGLGLAVVHGIVQSHRGRIVVVSEPGKGTTFDIYFPQADAAAGSLGAEKIEPLPLGGQERILLVDDELAIVETGQKILGYLGYEVVGRTNGTEALELFRANPGRFDLVITDMTMPNMTGDRLSMELLRIRPGLPIILCTGFSESISEEKARSLGVREFVMKPLVMKDLAKAIRRSLDRSKKRTGG